MCFEKDFYTFVSFNGFIEDIITTFHGHTINNSFYKKIIIIEVNSYQQKRLLNLKHNPINIFFVFKKQKNLS